MDILAFALLKDKTRLRSASGVSPPDPLTRDSAPGSPQQGPTGGSLPDICYKLVLRASPMRQSLITFLRIFTLLARRSLNITER